MITEVICENCGFILKINGDERCPEDVDDVLCCCDNPKYKYINGD